MSRITLTVLVLLSASATSATAAQTSTGNGQVVHNRLAPVLLHRAVPPYKGVHVYSPRGNRGGR